MKQTYQAPKLVRYGSVEQITLQRRGPKPRRPKKAPPGRGGS